MTPGQSEQAGRDLHLAEQALEAAELEMNREFLERAASSLYYAAFHAARAALTTGGIHSRTHGGQIHLFERTFGDAVIMSQLLALRTEADYAMKEFTASAQELRQKSELTKRFVDRCRNIVESEIARGVDDPDPPADLG